MNSIIVNILKDPKTCEMIDSEKIEDVVQLIEPHWSESDKEELYDIFFFLRFIDIYVNTTRC